MTSRKKRKAFAFGSEHQEEEVFMVVFDLKNSFTGSLTDKAGGLTLKITLIVARDNTS